MITKLKLTSILLICLTIATSAFAKNCKSLPDKDVLELAEIGCCYPSLLGRLPPAEYIKFMENVVFVEHTCRDTCSAELSPYKEVMVSQKLIMNELGLGEIYRINYEKAYNQGLLVAKRSREAKNDSALQTECKRRLTQCDDFCKKYEHFLHKPIDLEEMGFQIKKETKQLCRII